MKRARSPLLQKGLGVLHCTEGRCFVAGPCDCEKTKNHVLPKPVKIGRFTQKKRAGGGQKKRARSSGGSSSKKKKRAGASGGQNKRART